MLKLQTVDSISLFRLILGFVWNHLEIFDLDGHNLGTVSFARDPSADSKNIVSFRVSAYRFAQSQQRYPALSNKGRSTASAGPAIQETRDASGRVP